MRSQTARHTRVPNALVECVGNGTEAPVDNEAQTTQIQDDNANIGAAEAHPKPMLTVDQ